MDMAVLREQVMDWVGEMTERSIGEADLDTDLQDLGMDSLMALELAVQLERTYGLRLEEEELSTVRTLTDILKLAGSRG